MRRVLLLALVALAVVGPARVGLAPGRADVAGTRIGLPGSTTTVATSVSWDGTPRTFVLHVPGGLLAPAPLLIALHAYAQDADGLRRATALERAADRAGVIVAFPQGVRRSWNAVGCCGAARRDDVDDLGYLDAVVAATRARALVDPDRVALTGFSNGALLALRYGCERAGSVAAVAVVAGTVVSPCRPVGRVAVLDLHGEQDRTIPVQGGRNAALDAEFPPVTQALQPFAEHGGEVGVHVVPDEGHVWLPGATGAVLRWVLDHPRTP